MGPCCHGSESRKGNGKTGKTRKDHESGKWARRLSNRRSDFIRNNGGKQFGKAK